MAAQAPAPPATKRAACPRRRRPAVNGGHPAQPPGPAAVRRDEELGPGNDLTGFGAGRHDLGAGARHPASDSTMPRVLPGWYGAKSCPAGTAGGKLAAAGIRLLFAFTTRPPARPRTRT